MNGSVANAQQCVAALRKARAKHGVLPIGTCLPQTLDSILVGHYAAPERLMLRKDEPHPMASLMVTAQFLKCICIDMKLGLDKAVQIVGRVHGAIVVKAVWRFGGFEPDLSSRALGQRTFGMWTTSKPPPTGEDQQRDMCGRSCVAARPCPTPVRASGQDLHKGKRCRPKPDVTPTRQVAVVQLNACAR